MPPSRRGAALAAVLLVSAVLVVVCFALATLSVLNLNLARSYYSKSQARAMAIAAINQVRSELDRFESTNANSPLNVAPTRFDVINRFKSPVFPSGAQHLPGTVSITFAASDPYYSVDNLDSTVPATGWTDRYKTTKSVPPFSLDLVIAVDVSGQKTYFEAVLQRRWPYVLCTPGKVTLMGTPRLDLLDPVTRVAPAAEPSLVKGSVYSLLDATFDDDETRRRRPRPTPTDEEEEQLIEPEDEITVSNEIYDLVFQFIPGSLGWLTVGGSIYMNVEVHRGTLEEITVRSDGNALKGRVDLMADTQDRALVIAPNNTQAGGVRTDVHLYDVNRKLEQAFTLPNPSGLTPLTQQAVLGARRLPPGYRPPGGQPSPSPSPSANPSAAPGGKGPGVAPPVTTVADYYAIDGDDLKLIGGNVAPDQTFRYGSGARYVINSSAGNRWIEEATGELKESGAGIELRNSLLYVKGNLDLSATPPDEYGASRTPTLRGTNATIIVDGTLVLTNGALDAQDQGMVIYCKRLLSQARGHYKGLLLVEKSAAFFPPTAGERLKISGAIICGDAPILVKAPSREVVRPGPNGGPSERRTEQPSVELNGLRLWSTSLNYDARYLKTMHPLGPLAVMSLRQIP